MGCALGGRNNKLLRSQSPNLDFLDSCRALVLCVALPEHNRIADSLFLGFVRYTTRGRLDAQWSSQLHLESRLDLEAEIRLGYRVGSTDSSSRTTSESGCSATNKCIPATWCILLWVLPLVRGQSLRNFWDQHRAKV